MIKSNGPVNPVFSKDIVHVSAMGPPGGGRTEISGRLKRRGGWETLVGT